MPAQSNPSFHSARQARVSQYQVEFASLRMPLTAAQFADLGQLQREAYLAAAAAKRWAIPAQRQFTKAAVLPKPAEGNQLPLPLCSSHGSSPNVPLPKRPARPVFRSLKTVPTQILGQDYALAAIDELLEDACMGLSGGNGRPLASILIAGPSGVGKTETAKLIAEALYGTRTAVARINLNEHVGESAISQAFGAARGYQDSEKSGALVQALRRHNGRCVMLVDECEKGGPEFLRAMLTALDEGCLEERLTGERISLEHTVVVMTTNALSTLRGIDELSSSALRESLLGVLVKGQAIFPPEFIGRFDVVLGYRALRQAEMVQILQQRFEREARPRIKLLGLDVVGVEQETAEMLLEGLEQSPFGVRAIDNLIREHLIRPIKRLRHVLGERAGDYAWQWRAAANRSLALYPVTYQEGVWKLI